MLGSLQAHLGDVTNGDFCNVEVGVFDNGQQAFEIFANSDGTTTITPSQENEEAALLPGGGLQNLTATVTDSLRPAEQAPRWTLCTFPSCSSPDGDPHLTGMSEWSSAVAAPITARSRTMKGTPPRRIEDRKSNLRGV